MKKLRTIPGWGKLCAVLGVIAFFFRFTLRGYAYLAYALVFIAALIIAYHCVGAVLWRVIVILVCIGFAYFCFVESLIIGAARTDPEPGRKYLIVLGAAVYGDVPSLSLQNRLDGAMDYLLNIPTASPSSAAVRARARVSPRPSACATIWWSMALTRAAYSWRTSRPRRLKTSAFPST